MNLFTHNTVPTHSDVSPVENLANEVSEAFDRLSKIINNENILPSITSVVGNHILTDIEYYGVEKELTESFSVNKNKDFVLSLEPTDTTNISVSYLDTLTNTEVYLERKLANQHFTNTNQFKVLGKVLSISGDLSGTTIKVSYSGKRETFGNLQLRPNVIKDTNNVFEKPLTHDTGLLYYIEYDHDVSTQAEKLFGSPIIDKEKVYLLVKDGSTYKNVLFNSVHLTNNRVVFELLEELQDTYNAVAYVNNVSVSNFLEAFYKEYIKHSHDKTGNENLVSHSNLIDLYRNTDRIFYKDVVTPNYEHPQYLNREGYNPSVVSAYENALLGDLFLASKISAADQEFKSLIKDSNSILFGDPIGGSKLYYDATTKALSLLTGSGLNGLNVTIGPDNKALSINGTSYIQETNDELILSGKNDTVTIKANTDGNKSKLVADTINTNDSINTPKLITKEMELGNNLVKDVDNNLVFEPKDVDTPSKVNFKTAVEAEKIETKELRAIDHKLELDDKISINEKTYLTNKEHKFTYVTPNSVDFVSSGRHTGTSTGSSPNYSLNTYTANYLGQPGSDVDTSVYSEIPMDSDWYLIKNTRVNYTEGNKTYKFGTEQEQGVTNIQSLRDWKRAGMHSGDSTAYSLKLNASTNSKKNGLVIGTTKVYSVGPDTDCPTGMTIMESQETFSVIKPLPDDKEGCGDIGYQNVNTGNLQVFGNAAIDDSLMAVENITAGETLIGRNLNITEEGVINTLSVSRGAIISGPSEFNGDVQLNNTLNVNGSTTVGGTLRSHSLNTSDFANIEGSLTVNGQTVLNDDVIIDGRLNTSAGFTTSGVIQGDSLKVGPIEAGRITAIGGIQAEGSSRFVGPINLEGNLNVVGNGKFDGSFEVTKEITTEDLYVQDATTVEGTLSVKGDTDITGNSIVIGTKESTVNLSGIIHFNTGNATFTGDMIVLKNFTTSGTFHSTGDIKTAGELGGTTLNISATAQVGGLLTADAVEVLRKSNFQGGIEAGDVSTFNVLRAEEVMFKKGQVDDLFVNTSFSTGAGAVVRIENLITGDFSQVSKTADVSFYGETSFYNDVNVTGSLTIGNKDIQRTRSTSGIHLTDKELVMGYNSVIKSTKIYATKGTPRGSNQDLNAGFCFESNSQNGGTDGDTGMFATTGVGSGVDGSDLEFYIDGIRRGIIPKNVTNYSEIETASGDTLVDLHVLREALEDVKIMMKGFQANIAGKFWPVGSIYITTDTKSPELTLGVGTWVRFAAGRTLVGQVVPGAPGGDILGGLKVPDKFDAKTIGSYYGDFTHTLVVDELPKHSHKISQLFQRGGPHARMSGRWDAREGMTEAVGGDLPHNNVQPSIVVAMWQRIA